MEPATSSWAHQGRCGQSEVVDRDADLLSPERVIALPATIGGITFTITGLLGGGAFKVLALPWDPVIPDAASFVLALAFLVMIACIHHQAAPENNVWSLIGLAFAILYVAAVSIVYMTIITLVTPA